MQLATTMIDTHKLVTKLRTSGMTENQAEIVAEGLNDALSEQMVTRSDLDILEARLGSTIVASRNTQIIWTTGLVSALGMVQHFLK
jgi:hypothetical protein